MVNREKLAFAPICYIFAICSRSIYEHASRSPTQLIRKQPTLRDHAERLGVPGATQLSTCQLKLYGPVLEALLSNFRDLPVSFGIM